MPKQHTEIILTINRPIEEVFAYISTPENNVHWVSGLERVLRLSGNGVESLLVGRLKKRFEINFQLGRP